VKRETRVGEAGSVRSTLGPRIRLMSWAIVVTGVFIFIASGFQWREDRYSCHVCRALSEAQTISFFSLPVWQYQESSRQGEVVPSHRHAWWRYSYAYSDGPMGCLGKGTVCHTDGRFRDEQTSNN